MIIAFETGSFVPGAKGRWAWLQLLLDAQTGNGVWYGASITLPPFLDESVHSYFETANGQITISGESLRDYTNNKLNKSMNWFFPWRNTRPTHYLLNSQQYIDASRPRDLPDFRIVSADVVPLFLAVMGWVPLSVCGKGFTGGPSAVIDRYGYGYGMIFFGGQLSCLGYVSAGEGYVARTFSNIRWTQSEIPSHTDIVETITGPCLNGGFQVGIGLSGSICLNGATSATAFYTPGVGVAVYGSFGFSTPLQLPDLAWDYIDRIPGISESDVFQRIMNDDCQ